MTPKQKISVGISAIILTLLFGDKLLEIPLVGFLFSLSMIFIILIAGHLIYEGLKEFPVKKDRLSDYIK